MDDYYTDISRLFSRLIAALCTFSNCNLIFSITRPFLPIKIEQTLAGDSKNSIATPFLPSPRTFKTTFYKRPRTMSEQILRLFRNCLDFKQDPCFITCYKLDLANIIRLLFSIIDHRA